MKNNNNNKCLGCCFFRILTLVFCLVFCLVMPLLATVIGARLEIILWMATGILLIAGLIGAVAFLDSHAGLPLVMRFHAAWAMTRQTILREGCSPQASRRPRPEKESGGGVFSQNRCMNNRPYVRTPIAVAEPRDFIGCPHSISSGVFPHTTWHRPDHPGGGTFAANICRKMSPINRGSAKAAKLLSFA
jgi:hypothetical protein